MLKATSVTDWRDEAHCRLTALKPVDVGKLLRVSETVAGEHPFFPNMKGC